MTHPQKVIKRCRKSFHIFCWHGELNHLFSPGMDKRGKLGCKKAIGIGKDAQRMRKRLIEVWRAVLSASCLLKELENNVPFQ
jgi:hypothetical protein